MDEQDLTTQRPDIPDNVDRATTALVARPKRKRRLLKFALVTMGVAVVAAGGLWTALKVEPKAVRTQRQLMGAARPDEIKQLATGMESRLYESLGFAKAQGAPAAGPFSPRPGSLVLAPAANGTAAGLEAARVATADLQRPRTFMLTPEEANAWLSTNFQEWMSYRGFDLPKQVANPLIAVDGEDLLLSFDYNAYRVSQTFIAGFTVRFEESGMARLKLDKLSAGSVPIPIERIGEYLAEHSPDSDTGKQVGEWLAKLENATFKPVMKLENRLRALVVDYQLIDGNIELTLVLEDRSEIYQRKSKASVAVVLPDE